MCLVILASYCRASEETVERSRSIATLAILSMMAAPRSYGSIAKISKKIEN